MPKNDNDLQGPTGEPSRPINFVSTLSTQQNTPGESPSQPDRSPAEGGKEQLWQMKSGEREDQVAPPTQEETEPDLPILSRMSQRHEI